MKRVLPYIILVTILLLFFLIGLSLTTSAARIESVVNDWENQTVYVSITNVLSFGEWVVVETLYPDETPYGYTSFGPLERGIIYKCSLWIPPAEFYQLRLRTYLGATLTTLWSEEIRIYP